MLRTRPWINIRTLRNCEAGSFHISRSFNSSLSSRSSAYLSNVKSEHIGDHTPHITQTNPQKGYLVSQRCGFHSQYGEPYLPCQWFVLLFLQPPLFSCLLFALDKTFTPFHHFFFLLHFFFFPASFFSFF